MKLKTNQYNNISVNDDRKITREDKKIKEACDMFESLYYKKMLEIAYKDMDIMGKSTGNHIYKDMYLDELSKTTNGSLGLSTMMFKHLTENKGK